MSILESDPGRAWDMFNLFPAANDAYLCSIPPHLKSRDDRVERSDFLSGLRLLEETGEVMVLKSSTGDGFPASFVRLRPR
jgi:hypothetical protein